MHKLLQRQLKRCGLSGELPENLHALAALVDEAYTSIDADRAMNERSMEICSRELMTLTNELESRVAQRTAELRTANDQLTVAEQDYRTIFHNAPVGIFRTSVEGTYLKCNPALAIMYGYESPDELRASVRDIKRKLYVEDQARDRFKALIAQHDRIENFEARIFRKDGSIIWISETARIVRAADASIQYYEGFVTDITARKLAEESLRESEERYVLAMRGANDGLWDWNLREGLVYFSTRWKEMLGATEDQIGSLPEEWFKRVHGDDLTALQSAIAAHRDGTTPHFEVEHRMLHADGGYRWMLSRGMAIRDAAGAATRMAGSQTDITARKEAEEQLLKDALYDGLTGLPNRVLFLDRLERSIVRSTRDKEHRFSALFIDMDRFKVINDSLGHLTGDQLLIEFAKRLAACVRPSDTVARLGGDEFTILLEDPREPDDALGIAQRILEALRKPFVLGSHEVFVTTSIGIALSTTGYTRPQDVLRDADTALYRAKALGKAQAQVFDVSMHARAMTLLRVENDLRRAVDRNEFVLFYQPILKLGTGRIRAFEALIRWRHPERGIVSPMDFIPIAEETGLIVTIGKWVLNEGCCQAAAWLKAHPNYPIDININLSGKQFSQRDLVEQVTSALHRSGLPPQHLTLEITESVVMENPEAAIAMLHRLKAIGVQLHIDDFGTGYSSLAYLQRFPIDTMKIDRSFVSRIIEGTENAEIVRTIVTLAHNLNMKVTAEGIETAEQLAHLQHLKCENAQGYFLSRPVDALAAEQLLQNASRDEEAA